MIEAIWGNENRSQRPFSCLCGLAYCPATDLLYVADLLNHSIQVVRGLDGQCVQVLGKGLGRNHDEMHFPRGIAVDLNQIYIADSSNHRVVVYSKQHGTFLFQMGKGQGSDRTQFEGPIGVSVDSEAGVVYIADQGNRRVCVYRCCDGSYVRHFPVLREDHSLAYPIGVMWDAAAGVLFVTLQDSTTVCVYQCPSSDV
eukprot:TRINITY_DN1392_c0_g3_i2.p1 TRINITY_DN1392_c0_g3~~TRINITY_DN1392_c0_g3_i2.p1  ORF type:complete len:198 (+),score=15.18 TRINITY_DN1392_c0_g3_i2:190-783(+)